MVQSKVFSDHVDEYEKWYEEYADVYDSELVALREHFTKLPENLHGIEVGLGTGRFSRPLDIKEGIEPSEAMAQVAMSRGIEIMGGIAERLPYAD
ncbi:MAG: class I SAM-dependent methyltransferase, partial [Flavobacteriaceae bacterium]|nr:class I SAM-dependent methyltransferase [Flavobacteriaceae bacterium]